jgi:ClpP class serine protease
MTLQPWYIVLTFSRYIKENLAFTSNQRLHNRAKKVHDYFTQKVLKPYHLSLDHVFFTGRLGYPTKTNIRRSVRKDLDL